jgi:flagellar basal-body rod protein FlgF
VDRLIYLAMAGAKASMQRQDVLTHNLANVSTTGFRAELAAQRAVPVEGDGASTRVYALETTVGYDARPGTVESTGRALDVALRGNAWLAVQGADGAEAYTRAGALTVDAQGQLVDPAGWPLLGEGGPIVVPPDARVSIAADGSVSAAATGNAPAQVVGRLKMVTPPAALTRGEDGLFRAADGDPLPSDPDARLQDGALEGSNVGAVETMVAMITAARAFEHQMRVLQGAEQRDQAAQRLLGPGTA